MYAAPSAFCRKGKYYTERAEKDKENKGVKATDNGEGEGGKEIERMRKIEQLQLRYLIYILASVSQQKLCVQDYKQTIIPVFITVHITVCLCRTYCNGVVWFWWMPRAWVSIRSSHYTSVCVHSL